MDTDIKSLGDFGFAGDDRVVPFDVSALDIRGRVVQLGPLLDTILGRHDYPVPVARLIAEMITLTVLLGTSLKFDGKLIVQTKGDGPVDLVVADFRTPGDVRAYARFDEEGVKAAIEAGRAQPTDLLGNGILAFTIDQGAFMQRYQGIVEMKGETLEKMAEGYFRQSEQIPTLVRLSVAELLSREDGHASHHWRAGGLVVQFLPEAPDRMRLPDLPGGDDPSAEIESVADDSWAEASVLVATVDAGELTDPGVGAERLLYRLFHEHGVRVYPPAEVADKCSCSREKLAEVLSGFTAEEITESTENGSIAVTCEFCSTTYVFDPAEFQT